MNYVNQKFVILNLATNKPFDSNSTTENNNTFKFNDQNETTETSENELISSKFLIRINN